MGAVLSVIILGVVAVLVLVVVIFVYRENQRKEDIEELEMR